jgi:hypothetical protein
MSDLQSVGNGLAGAPGESYTTRLRHRPRRSDIFQQKPGQEGVDSSLQDDTEDIHGGQLISVPTMSSIADGSAQLPARTTGLRVRHRLVVYFICLFIYIFTRNRSVKLTRH